MGFESGVAMSAGRRLAYWITGIAHLKQSNLMQVRTGICVYLLSAALKAENTKGFFFLSCIWLLFTSSHGGLPYMSSLPLLAFEMTGFVFMPRFETAEGYIEF